MCLHGVCKCMSRLRNMTGHVGCAAACRKAENMHGFMPILHDARHLLRIVRHCSMLFIKQHNCDKLCSATLAHRADWLAATRTCNNRLNIAMNYHHLKGLFFTPLNSTAHPAGNTRRIYDWPAMGKAHERADLHIQRPYNIKPGVRPCWKAPSF